MARLVKPLTVTQINNAKPKATTYKLFDGGGLFLQVSPAGGKHWKLKYTKDNGKEGLLSFGAYPDVSLEQARKKREAARAQKASGIDPGEAKRQEKAERLAQAKNTFRAVTNAWLDLERARITPNSIRTYEVILDKYLLPPLGELPVKNLKSGDFLEAIRRIEDKGIFATSRRASHICSKIMRYAIALGLVEFDPLPSLNNLLKPYKRGHHAAAIEPTEVGNILRLIDLYGGTLIVRTALKIMPYVFVRTNELRTARWADIDFKTCEWRYTVSKTKTQHIVPLARPVIVLLHSLYDLTGNGELVFPNTYGKNKSISQTTMITALRSLDIPNAEMTIHGFRATARTLLDEVLGERYDLIEHQLAHTVRDPNGRAYNRTQHLPERKRMMTRWALYLDNLRAGNNEIPPFNPLESKQVEFVD
jgi:integrase